MNYRRLAVALVAIFLITVAILLTMERAMAGWDIQHSDEDVFGNINVTISAYGSNGTLLRAECGSDKEPRVAFLVRSNPINTTMGAEMLFKDANGQLEKGFAQLGDWNDKYVAIEMKDKDWIKKFLAYVGAAQKSIAIGVTVDATEWKHSDTFTASGSTKAAEKFLASCFKEGA